jgi:hypothetical protein
VQTDLVQANTTPAAAPVHDAHGLPPAQIAALDALLSGIAETPCDPPLRFARVLLLSAHGIAGTLRLTGSNWSRLPLLSRDQSSTLMLHEVLVRRAEPIVLDAIVAAVGLLQAHAAVLVAHESGLQVVRAAGVGPHPQ